MNAISTPKSRYGVVSQLRRSDSIRQDYGVTVDWTRDVCTRGRRYSCCCCWMHRSASTGECTSASPCVVVVTVSCEKTRAWSLCTRHRAAVHRGRVIVSARVCRSVQGLSAVRP